MADYDLIVVGAGSAGLSLTAGAAQLGARVALIERGRMGGDCLNAGCVPSKALLAAGHAARAGAEAAELGVRYAPPVVDWPAVRAHIQRVIAAIAPNDSEERFQGLGAEVIRGEARFVDPATIAVEGRRLTARRIVLATGSRAAIPPIPGLDAGRFETNETIFDLPELPAHLLILGAGPIGLEMADAFAGLGARVTVLEADRVLGREDPELAAALTAALRARGIAIHEGAAVARVHPGPEVELSDGRRIAGSHLLVATGRRPNIEALDLDKGGVAATRAGVAVDRGLRSVSNKRVFAAGDVADVAGLGVRALTHVGSYHAGLLVRRSLFRLPARVDYAALPRAIYTDPELAWVGATRAEAGQGAAVLRWSLAENDRAQAERATDGLVKLVVAKGRVVGAGMVGPHAGEIFGQWTLAIGRRLPMSALAGAIAPYPTLAEAGKRAAGAYFAPKLFSERTRRLVRWLSRLP